MQQALLELAAPDREQFFAAGLAVLEAMPESLQRPQAFERLLSSQPFLLELIRMGRYSDRELNRLCAAWIKIDTFLDLHLAALLPGREEDLAGLPVDVLARVLDALHHISKGPRLILLVNHLKNHPDRAVAEKATLLVGRRIRNLGWVKQRLASTDTRIRAAAVEGLWGVDTPSARSLLEHSRNDDHHRVVANALLGLNLLGDRLAKAGVIEMSHDARVAFRHSAVWAMGQMGAAEFIEPLRAALADPEAEVRLGAKQALAAIRKAEREVSVDVKPAPAPAEELPPPQEEPAFGFHFDGSFHRQGARTGARTGPRTTPRTGVRKRL